LPRTAGLRANGEHGADAGGREGAITGAGALVFQGRAETQRLAEILLVQPVDPVAIAAAVEARDEQALQVAFCG